MPWLEIVRGLVRPLTTVLVIVAVIALTVTGTLAPDHLVSMASMMVGFWFGQRDKPGPTEG